MERTRSLTKRPSSSAKSVAEDTADQPPLPEVPVAEVKYDVEVEGQSPKQPNSPLLTSHRLSTTSLDNVNLDNVSLGEDSTSVKEDTANGNFTRWYPIHRILTPHSQKLQVLLLLYHRRKIRTVCKAYPELYHQFHGLLLRLRLLRIPFQRQHPHHLRGRALSHGSLVILPHNRKKMWPPYLHRTRMGGEIPPHRLLQSAAIQK